MEVIDERYVTPNCLKTLSSGDTFEIKDMPFLDGFYMVLDNITIETEFNCNVTFSDDLFAVNLETGEIEKFSKSMIGYKVNGIFKISF